MYILWIYLKNVRLGINIFAEANLLIFSQFQARYNQIYLSLFWLYMLRYFIRPSLFCCEHFFFLFTPRIYFLCSYHFSITSVCSLRLFYFFLSFFLFNGFVYLRLSWLCRFLTVKQIKKWVFYRGGGKKT